MNCKSVLFYVYVKIRPKFSVFTFKNLKNIKSQKKNVYAYFDDLKIRINNNNKVKKMYVYSKVCSLVLKK